MCIVVHVHWCFLLFGTKTITLYSKCSLSLSARQCWFCMHEECTCKFMHFMHVHVMRSIFEKSVSNLCQWQNYKYVLLNSLATCMPHCHIGHIFKYMYWYLGWGKYYPYPRLLSVWTWPINCGENCVCSLLKVSHNNNMQGLTFSMPFLSCRFNSSRQHNDVLVPHDLHTLGHNLTRLVTILVVTLPMAWCFSWAALMFNKCMLILSPLVVRDFFFTRRNSHLSLQLW